jgi:hypothetical protein
MMVLVETMPEAQQDFSCSRFGQFPSVPRVERRFYLNPRKCVNLIFAFIFQTLLVAPPPQPEIQEPGEPRITRMTRMMRMTKSKGPRMTRLRARLRRAEREWTRNSIKRKSSALIRVIRGQICFSLLFQGGRRCPLARRRSPPRPKAAQRVGYTSPKAFGADIPARPKVERVVLNAVGENELSSSEKPIHFRRKLARFFSRVPGH